MVSEALSICSVGSDEDAEGGAEAGSSCSACRRRPNLEKSDRQMPKVPWSPPGLSESMVIQGTAEEYFDFEDVLGTGMDMVLLARERYTRQKVAIKRIPPERIVEVDILKKLRHPNIVDIIGVFERGDHVDIVMEYMPERDLFEFLSREKSLSERQARDILRQILSALAYLHDCRVVHFDIKMENVLVAQAMDPMKVKLTDFGISEILPAEGNADGQLAGASRWCPCSRISLSRKRRDSVIGTRGYIAPELRRFRATGDGAEDISAAVDLYSCGVVLHVMLTGKFPPEKTTDGDAARSKDGRCRDLLMPSSLSVEGPEWERASREARDLVKQLLQEDPRARTTARQALRHDWFRLSSRASDVKHLPAPDGSVRSCRTGSELLSHLMRRELYGTNVDTGRASLLSDASFVSSYRDQCGWRKRKPSKSSRDSARARRT